MSYSGSYNESLTASSPSRDPNARHTRSSTSSEANWTLPSTRTRLTPPVCQLEAVDAPPLALKLAPRLPPALSREQLRSFGGRTWL